MKGISTFVIALLALVASFSASAQVAPTSKQRLALLPNQRMVVLGAKQFVLPGIAAGGGIDCYYGKALYYPNAAACATTVSRASIGTCPDSSGTYYQFANNVLRLPPTQSAGACIEEARTNGVRNNTMVGAVAGTPGTLPTNWVLGTTAGITTTIVGTGIINGLNYLDIRYFGTAGATGNQRLGFEASTQIAATYGQTWAQSTFVTVVGGSLTNITVSNFIREFNSGGTQVSLDGAVITPTSAVSRFVNVQTLGQVTTAFVAPYIYADFVNGAVIDVTIRIGWPQLENNSLINSTVNAGAQTVTNSGTSTCVSGTYTVSGGTGTAATLTGVAAGGVITSLTTLTGGSYTVFPPSPAALTGTGCSGSPTATLTPTNNAAQGFATTPIPTSAGAVTRAADVVTLTNPPKFGSAYTLFASGTPEAQSTYTVNQGLAAISDGTNNNRLTLFKNQIGSAANFLLETSGSIGVNIQVGSQVWTTNVQGKSAEAAIAGNQTGAFNAVTQAGSAPTMPVGVNSVQVGNVGAGGSMWNGQISRIALWLNTALPASTLQAITNLNAFN